MSENDIKIVYISQSENIHHILLIDYTLQVNSRFRIDKYSIRPSNVVPALFKHAKMTTPETIIRALLGIQI